jgi:hypothetical protein
VSRRPQHRHGLHDVAARHLAQFEEGLRHSAAGGNVQAQTFALLTGHLVLKNDSIGALADPAACTFYLELERKAVRSAALTGRSDRLSHHLSVAPRRVLFLCYAAQCSLCPHTTPHMVSHALSHIRALGECPPHHGAHAAHISHCARAPHSHLRTACC